MWVLTFWIWAACSLSWAVKPVNLFLLLLHFAMCFQEFVEQHRVHLVVTYAVGLSIFVAHDQIRIYVFYLLGDEAKLRDSLGINFVLVAKGHRFERKDRFACLVHRLDLVLETLRARGHTKLTVGVDNNSCTCHWYRKDTSDKGARLSFHIADADRESFASDPIVADVNIEIARREVETCHRANGDVVVSGCVIVERCNPSCRIVVAGGVANKRSLTGGRVVVAGRVVEECKSTVGGVLAAACVVKERLVTVSYVFDACRIGKKRERAVGRVSDSNGVA